MATTTEPECYLLIVAERTRAQVALAAREAFEEGFRRSRKSNLWRRFDGKTITVFTRSDGMFGWAIADSEGPTYSPGGYAEEDDAVAALWWEMEGRYL